MSGFALFIGITFNFFKMYASGLISKSSFFAIAATFLFSIAPAKNIASRLDLWLAAIIKLPSSGIFSEPITSYLKNTLEKHLKVYFYKQ